MQTSITEWALSFIYLNIQNIYQEAFLKMNLLKISGNKKPTACNFPTNKHVNLSSKSMATLRKICLEVTKKDAPTLPLMFF